ncbi:MAG: helical membrane plugin domain-containing protein [Thermoleophilia bacterium]
MEQTLLTVDQKLDLLADQVQYLTEQAQCAARRQGARAELLDDATPIINDVFRITTEQLEEVRDYVDLSDLLRLLKRLMRNTRNLDAMLDQLESLADLGRTVAPLVGDAFEKATDLLETAEHKGYFAFAKGGVHVADKIVTSFGPEDVEKLGDNAALILNVVKDMTQPEIMNLARNIISANESELKQPVKTSLLSLLGQMRDPEFRRGLALTMRLLRVIAAQAAGSPAGK